MSLLFIPSVVKIQPHSSSFIPAQAASSTRPLVTAVPLRRSSPRILMHGHGHGGPPAAATEHGHGHGHGAAMDNSERRPGSHKGFVEEMRFIAMKLHTKDQAPMEGKMEESALPIQAWRPKQADYLQFLVDSQLIYNYIESTIAASNDPQYAPFKNTGLERSDALKKDIAWMQEAYPETCSPVPSPTAKAVKYIDYLKTIVNDNPQAFICHWYNYYFAHSAGGIMIGKMMSNMLFDGKSLEFYKWDRPVKEILGEVRVNIDDAAKDWSREKKDQCLDETGLAFTYSGMILNNLAKA